MLGQNSCHARSLRSQLDLSSQPTSIFRGGLKLALFSVVPAAFVGYVPVEILRAHDLSWLLAHLGVACGFLLLGAWVFARGLERYESGNLITVRV